MLPGPLDPHKRVTEYDAWWRFQKVKKVRGHPELIDRTHSNDHDPHYHRLCRSDAQRQFLQVDFRNYIWQKIAADGSERDIPRRRNILIDVFRKELDGDVSDY